MVFVTAYKAKSVSIISKNNNKSLRDSIKLIRKRGFPNVEPSTSGMLALFFPSEGHGGHSKARESSSSTTSSSHEAAKNKIKLNYPKIFQLEIITLKQNVSFSPCKIQNCII